MKKIILSMGILASTVAFGQSQIDLPIDWEGTAVNYTVADFGGNASSLDVDPTNANNTVMKSEKTVGAETWAGTTMSTPSGLASAIPFAPGSTVITMRVYSPDANTPVRMKVEDASDPAISVETEVTTTVANAWETLSFDFAAQAPGTAAINFSSTYNKLSVFYNFGTNGATAGAKTYYCDDIEFAGTSTVSNVTFQVDMSTYSGSFTTPEVNGSFNGWCGNCNALSVDPNNPDIWQITLPITDDTIEYKFSYDNWSGEETLTSGSACTQTTGQFTNRILVLNGDTILPAVCWEECVTCAQVSVVSNEIVSDLSIFPNPASSEIYINGYFTSNENNQISIVDVTGKVILNRTLNTQIINERIDIQGLSNGLYLIRIENNHSFRVEKVLIQK
jgi:hypothetical protein